MNMMEKQKLLNMTLEGNVSTKDVLKLYELRDDAYTVLYDPSGVRYTFNVGEPFNHGSCANVFRVGDRDEQVLKKYFSTTGEYLRMTKKTFEFIKSLNHPNIIHPIQYYFTSENLEPWDLIEAYTYPYVEEQQVDLLSISKDYLLENLYSLERLINAFTKEKIILGDLAYSNTVINREKIVITDPDCFRFSKDFRRKHIIELNRHELLIMMRDIMYHYTKDLCPIQNAEALFSLDLKYEKNITDQVTKRLKHVKYIRDYIK